ncbi:MAG: PSD1 and planctomycete cytochrome C domain-containing protein [Planctomycetes bacterium]|nr:PSD1 and planctomycete cytochrome C domain-containing protein [Planctomycetota bacterium]
MNGSDPWGMCRRSAALAALWAFLAAPSWMLAAESIAPVAPLPQRVEFNRHIRPILSDNCYKCHGPDKNTREAGMRLDVRADAIKPHDSDPAIVPGNAASSEMIRRILATDPAEQMPPPKSGKHVTPQQIELLRRWIDLGAEYQSHWSFIAPTSPPLPEVQTKAWPRGSIDRFVLARLEQETLQPAPEADRRTLIRRVTFDLTGLPPTPAEVQAFLADSAPDAYEKLVDRLLASPRYAEHMARQWLDLARFADTNGYQYDQERTQWPWRDWVIDAFARNMPFNEFTVEQLAGDQLPGARPNQILATGFNRNHGITVEGGVVDEEYRVEYVMDRVNTTTTVWLGLTMGCSRCHDHKFDPISRKEFYQFYAFFNQVDEKGMNGFDPRINVLSPLQLKELEVIDREIEPRQRALREPPTADASGPNGTDARKRHQEELAKLLQRRKKYEGTPVRTLIMRDRAQPRETFMLERGQYDQNGEKVSADVPAALPPLAADVPKNRLALARWLVDPKHPLTARVAVNRFWQHYFGTGLVKTAEDFGTQGEWPSHPDLLDYLATEFVSSGWDVRKMQRLIVTSATYRQSAAANAALRERDPDNRLLARGPRLRLEAEEIRDTILAVSGQLVEKVGGPSVYPYQPPGLWTELNNREGFSKDYPQGKGEDLYRRSMYTFWKRTVPPPMMQTFDAPNREVCVARRSRTNTPLQSLAMMYSPQSVEAARHLAARMLREGGDSTQQRIVWGMVAATAREPEPADAAVLLKLYETQRAAFSQDKPAALKLLSVGDSPRDEKLDPIDHAAMTTVARVILNLDETITKP